MNQKEGNIFEIITDDVMDWARAFETYFEKSSVAHIALKAVFLLTAIISAYVDFLQVTDGFWTDDAIKIFLIALLVVMLIVDYGHVILARKRGIEIQRQRRLLTNMSRIIRDASGLNKTPYDIVEWYIEHDIQDNGDLVYKRRMEIKYVGETVYWVHIPIGVIDGDGEDRSEDLQIEVTNPTDGGSLPFAVTGDSGEKKEIAVMLEPPVRPNANSSLRLKFQWRGAYKPLISSFSDKGKITVHHYATNVTLRFIGPRGYKLTSIRMVNDIGKFEITEQTDGRSILTWFGNDLKKGEYSYSLIAARKEP